VVMMFHGDCATSPTAIRFGQKHPLQPGYYEYYYGWIMDRQTQE
jgi:hypothetical protein